MYLEIALRMIAGRADGGCLCSNDDVSAISALPYLDLALAEYLCGLDIAEQRAVALLVMTLYLSDEAEACRKLR